MRSESVTVKVATVSPAAPAADSATVTLPIRNEGGGSSSMMVPVARPRVMLYAGRIGIEQQDLECFVIFVRRSLQIVIAIVRSVTPAVKSRGPAANPFSVCGLAKVCIFRTRSCPGGGIAGCRPVLRAEVDPDALAGVARARHGKEKLRGAAILFLDFGVSDRKRRG